MRPCSRYDNLVSLSASQVYGASMSIHDPPKRGLLSYARSVCRLLHPAEVMTSVRSK
jgi:hypothetical protein